MRISTVRKVEITERVLSGDSVRRVSAELNVPLSTTYYHASSVCNHQARLDLSKMSVQELGYLLGVYVGDGSLIHHKLRGEFLIKICLDAIRDRDICDFICSIFDHAGKPVTVTRDGKVSVLRVWSKPLYDYILNRVRLRRRPLSKRYTKILIEPEKWNRNFAVGFLGGLIDSDGHVVSRKKTGHCGARITTSSLSLRDQLRTLCKRLGVQASLRIDRRGAPLLRPRYIVLIHSAGMNRICPEILSIKHERLHGGPGRT